MLKKKKANKLCFSVGDRTKSDVAVPKRRDDQKIKSEINIFIFDIK